MATSELATPAGPRARAAPQAAPAAATTAAANDPAAGAPFSNGPRRAPPRQDVRVLNQPGFVLHSRPYSETSLIIDVLSREYGRLSLLAKGAKRPHSALRGVLQTFQPLALGWSGKSEMRTLTRAEWVGGMVPLQGDALLCGFYVNELLVRFCAREDPHERLFDHYVETLTRLGHQQPPVQVLRSFERVLLRETGYAVSFDTLTSSARGIAPGASYVFDPEHGARAAQPSDPSTWPVVVGQTLIDMERDDYRLPRTVAQSKLLMRFLLNYYLDGVPLHTRQILLDLQNL